MRGDSGIPSRSVADPVEAGAHHPRRAEISDVCALARLRNVRAVGADACDDLVTDVDMTGAHP
ncbi:hypothetical protein BJP65_08435 [Microbacterium sp. BH-3-3-3]|nr:hypothetical protein BJP65_08435 [Microbacterium sp. BH-3-3-3]